MNPINSTVPSSLRRLGAPMLLAVATVASGCATNSPSYDNQMVFNQPEEAATRLASAVKAADPAPQLEAIFGAHAREILSGGDPVADRRNREVVALAMTEGWTLDRKDASTRELIIGNENWPFPIPLVKDGRGWWFDTAAGKEEVRARRIGHNELSTLATLRAYVDAQREYAQTGHDGGPAGVYAQQIRSDQGRHNGLYWPRTTASDPSSPLGEFVAAASAEGYGPNKEGAAPYHGYFYRVLTRQGPGAPGGAKDFVMGGSMSGGFAMIAVPAEYGNSGVMTFIVGPDGVVYQSDLGDDTATIAAAIVAYAPDHPWQPAK